MRLNVLGPSLNGYGRRKDMQGVADYILSENSRDPRLQDLADDVCISTFALLLLDLNVKPSETWPLFRSALLAVPRRSVISYPALNAALLMYGHQLSEAMQYLKIQGGNDLFLALVSSGSESRG
jgi:hypothetical protein